jgi:hypothetical protein
MVVAQIILLLRWFNKKNLVKMVESKFTCPKWHFGQAGHGNKKKL